MISLSKEYKKRILNYLDENKKAILNDIKLVSGQRKINHEDRMKVLEPPNDIKIFINYIIDNSIPISQGHFGKVYDLSELNMIMKITQQEEDTKFEKYDNNLFVPSYIIEGLVGMIVDDIAVVKTYGFYIYNKKDLNFGVVFQEKIEPSIVQDIIEKDSTRFIFLLVFFIMRLQEKYRFVHNDLHVKNIGWRTYDRIISISFPYSDTTMKTMYLQPKYLPCIYDFGLSRCTLYGMNIMCNPRYKDYATLSGTFDTRVDIAIFLGSVMNEIYKLDPDAASMKQKQFYQNFFDSIGKDNFVSILKYIWNETYRDPKDYWELFYFNSFRPKINSMKNQKEVFNLLSFLSQIYEKKIPPKKQSILKSKIDSMKLTNYMIEESHELKSYISENNTLLDIYSPFSFYCCSKQMTIKEGIFEISVGVPNDAIYPYGNTKSQSSQYNIMIDESSPIDEEIYQLSKKIDNISFKSDLIYDILISHSNKKYKYNPNKLEINEIRSFSELISKGNNRAICDYVIFMNTITKKIDIDRQIGLNLKLGERTLTTQYGYLIIEKDKLNIIRYDELDIYEKRDHVMTGPILIMNRKLTNINYPISIYPERELYFTILCYNKNQYVLFKMFGYDLEEIQNTIIDYGYDNAIVLNYDQSGYGIVKREDSNFYSNNLRTLFGRPVPSILIVN